MTDEIRQKLYGMSITKKGINVKYIPRIEDVPEEFLPTFNLKTFTVDEVTQLKTIDFTDPDNEAEVLELVRTHIVGWDNFIDVSSEDLDLIEFEADSSGGCDKELFAQMKPQTKLSIFQYLSQISMM